ncbi:MAG TPA: thiamine diphosphokinase [Acidimicrobiia bacterium]|nr:thiamine diphosphokinase [Acidimicrobiia bacterium]
MGAHERVLALVFTGGDPPTVHDQRDLTDPALVVAADAGLHHAQQLGYRVDVVVGDLDSADPAAVAAAEVAGATIERHPAAKDASDLELALAAALERGSTDIVVLGGHGGRLDHFLANTLLLASPAFAAVRVEARFDGATVFVVRDHLELHGSPGDVLTLLPLGGPAVGVVTSGLRYPLRSETLLPGSTRGLSNELVEPTATIAVADGVLLAVLPRPERPLHGKVIS